MPKRLAPFLFATLAGAACSSGGAPSDGGTCIQGQSIACACTDGMTGAQVCESGGAFGLCTCAEPPVDGGPEVTDAGTADAGTTDAGTIDAGVTPLDAGPDVDAGGSPVAIVGSTTTSALGFPTAWFEFPIDGIEIFTSLSGTVSVTNSADLYSEELFIIEFLPMGGCTPGMLPSSTPQGGPPFSTSVAQFIVKTPSMGTVTLPIDLTLPGGVPISTCLALGINGGSVEMPHAVSAAADLSLAFVPPQTSGQLAFWVGGEMCFGQDFGCQLATTDDTQSFAAVTPITQTEQLVALYGDISDSTFDGTSTYGPLPAGAWTATNDVYVYHGAECTTFGVSSGPVGPGSYLSSIPADATPLLSMPMTGNGLGVATQQVFQSFSDITLNAGDCIVTLWGLQGGGAFDNETQIFALVVPGQ